MGPDPLLRAEELRVVLASLGASRYPHSRRGRDERFGLRLEITRPERSVHGRPSGELSFQAPAIFYYAVGWYSGDAAEIFRPSPREEAERIVKLAGGREAVLKEAQAAFDRHEFAWAAELVNYLYKLDPMDKDARAFKAKVLRQLAYLSTGANPRSHLLTAALALEGKVQVPRLFPPRPEVIAASPETFVDYFRVRIDPEKSGETDRVLWFDFTGDHKTVGLHVRRAVAEFLPDPAEHYRSADVILSLSGEAWAKLYLSTATLEDLVKAGEIEVKRGTVEEASKLLALFDVYKPERAVLVRPHLHD
jgi:alkyl sulfatase BDS1-like metallo-beta-lactamase superfamily hydrolase